MCCFWKVQRCRLSLFVSLAPSLSWGFSEIYLSRGRGGVNAADGSPRSVAPPHDHCSSSVSQQSAGDAPTTPKYTKEHRDLFFPASLPTPVLLSHTACHPLSTQDGQAKVVYEPLSKLSRPQTSSFHDQTQHRRAGAHPAAAMAFLPHTGTTGCTPTHHTRVATQCLLTFPTIRKFNNLCRFLSGSLKLLLR